MQLSYVLFFDIKGHFCHFWLTSAAACSATVTPIPVEAFYLGLVRLVCFSASSDSTASLVRI